MSRRFTVLAFGTSCALATFYGVASLTTAAHAAAWYAILFAVVAAIHYQEAIKE